MQYKVHVYAVVRVPYIIEAESQQEAITKAQADSHLYTDFRDLEAEYTEEIINYLVDEIGDTEYEHSQWYDVDQKPEMVTR